MSEENSSLLISLRNLGLDIFRKYSVPRWLVLLLDTSAVFITFQFAYLLRFNLSVSAYSIPSALKESILVVAVYLIFSLAYRSYSGLIRHTTIKDNFNLILTTTTSLAVLVSISLLGRKFGWDHTINIPLSILMIHYGVITVLLSFVRVIIKMSFEYISSSNSARKNVLIFGAGAMGIAVKRIIQGENTSGMRVKGFLDDDRKLKGKSVNGHLVYDPESLNNGMVDREQIKILIIAINSISRERKAEVINAAIKHNLEILEAPGVDNWLQGKLSIRQLKKVQPEDLLGRDPIALDMKTIQEGLSGKTIMVTGAAGSIGSEIVRQLARFSTGTLLLVDQAETPVFYLTGEMKQKYPGTPVKIVVADVTSSERMEQLFVEYQPEIVFHAAAYKHVPVMEDHPHEAFRVNVGGTRTIAELSIKYGVSRFVMISSDKAVNPTNVMGATKRLCELYVQTLSARNDITTQFVTTRFGNVLGSNGSVIPLFRRQIKNGGPVTITHEDITRYFMTIPEACQLVLEAGFMGRGGEIFVFDMGEPVRIRDLAEKMIHLSGYQPGVDIRIEVTGLRPGEKLYEELLSGHEAPQPTHHPKIMIAREQGNDHERINGTIDSILASIYNHSHDELIGEIEKLVPEYRRTTNDE